MPTSQSTQLPFLTTDIPGVPASIKRDYADFVVEEIPAYEPSGKGDHVYFTIEKAGIATMHAVNDIARALGVAPREIGVAGLKDARAIARQTLSLEHADPDRVAALAIPRLRVLSVSRHGNKLRIGHLRGNRFAIKLRDVDAGALPTIRAALERLARRGVPNYFGPQRFGLRGDTGRIGEALIRRDDDAVVKLMCGSPNEYDTGDVLKARQLFEQGEYHAASHAWPHMFRDCALVCRVMASSGGKARKAVNALNRNAKKFFISAYQSWLFNQVLAKRITEIDRIMTGDLAWKHDNTAVFKVEDAAVEQPRADRFEISPTGPIFGYRMTQPTGGAAEIESQVLSPTGLTCESFGQLGPLSSPGGRRPLRFPIRESSAEASQDDRGSFVELRFALPSGCYATSLLREICKAELKDGIEVED